jgi:hypothetical protein
MTRHMQCFLEGAVVLVANRDDWAEQHGKFVREIGQKQRQTCGSEMVGGRREGGVSATATLLLYNLGRGEWTVLGARRNREGPN